MPPKKTPPKQAAGLSSNPVKKIESFSLRLEEEKYLKLKALAEETNLKLVDLGRIAVDALLDYTEHHHGRLTLPLNLNQEFYTIEQIQHYLQTHPAAAEHPTPYSLAKNTPPDAPEKP